MNQNYSNQEPFNNLKGQEPLPNAVVILVLGILSILVCQPLGIAAWIMSNSSISAYQQQPERYSEGSLSMVKAGRICGIIGVCLMALFVLLMLAGVSVFSFFAFND